MVVRRIDANQSGFPHRDPQLRARADQHPVSSIPRGNSCLPPPAKRRDCLDRKGEWLSRACRDRCRSMELSADCFGMRHRAPRRTLCCQARQAGIPALMGVTILALTLNEIDGVRAVLPHIDRSWYDQLIVVDGGSTDGTIQWCLEHGYEVYVQRRKGIRFAYLEVLGKIVGDIVVTLSPDGNCDPAWIPALVNRVKDGHDLVIASRYKGDATSQDDDLITGF